MSASQKVVVVTGASQGIGAGSVKAFRALGYRIVTGEILHVDGRQSADH